MRSVRVIVAALVLLLSVGIVTVAAQRESVSTRWAYSDKIALVSFTNIVVVPYLQDYFDSEAED